LLFTAPRQTHPGEIEGPPTVEPGDDPGQSRRLDEPTTRPPPPALPTAERPKYQPRHQTHDQFQTADNGKRKDYSGGKLAAQTKEKK